MAPFVSAIVPMAAQTTARLNLCSQHIYWWRGLREKRTHERTMYKAPTLQRVALVNLARLRMASDQNEAEKAEGKDLTIKKINRKVITCAG